MSFGLFLFDSKVARPKSFFFDNHLSNIGEQFLEISRALTKSHFRASFLVGKMILKQNLLAEKGMKSKFTGDPGLTLSLGQIKPNWTSKRNFFDFQFGISKVANELDGLFRSDQFFEVKVSMGRFSSRSTFAD